MTLARLDAAVADATDPDTPLTIALMRILIEAPTQAEAEAALLRGLAVYEATGDRAGAARLGALRKLWAETPNAWAAVRGTIEGIAHTRRDDTPDGTLRYWAEAFDRLAAASPEASVALYSLGDPGHLAAATGEVVDRMAAWGLLGPDRDVLDVGCGIGRFLAALSPRVRTATGLDIADRMVAEAATRCAGLPNVRARKTAGRDLAMIPDRSCDLVLAADVFPYVVQAGGDLPAQFFRDVARVLKPGGHALILNFSYRGDLDADRADCARLAAASGLTVRRAGTRDLTLWDATTFLLRA